MNADRDRRRRQRNALPLTEREVISRGDQPDVDAAANELHARIRAAIAELPDRQREVTILSLGEGLPAKEVAKVLGTTVANVHTCLHLARKQIARVIGVEYARREPS